MENYVFSNVRFDSENRTPAMRFPAKFYRVKIQTHDWINLKFSSDVKTINLSQTRTKKVKKKKK